MFKATSPASKHHLTCHLPPLIKPAAENTHRCSGRRSCSQLSQKNLEMGPTGMSLSGLGSDLATLCNKHFAILDIFNYFLCVCVCVCVCRHSLWSSCCICAASFLAGDTEQHLDFVCLSAHFIWLLKWVIRTSGEDGGSCIIKVKEKFNKITQNKTPNSTCVYLDTGFMSLYT